MADITSPEHPQHEAFLEWTYEACTGDTDLGFAEWFKQEWEPAQADSESVEDRLEYLRSQIEAECISTGELIELQGLAEYINPGDVQLLEWAGVPEFPEEEDDEDLPLILALDDDYCPKSKDGTHKFGEDRTCDLCGASEEEP